MGRGRDKTKHKKHHHHRSSSLIVDDNSDSDPQSLHLFDQPIKHTSTRRSDTATSNDDSDFESSSSSSNEQSSSSSPPSLLSTLYAEKNDFLSSICSTTSLLQQQQDTTSKSLFADDTTKKPIIQPLASFDDQMSSLERYFLEAFHIDYKQRFEVKDKKTYVLDPPKNRQMSDGEARLKRFEEILESGFKWRRHRFQRGFHDEVVKAVAASIVGPEDWDRVGPRIIKERKWDKIAQMVMAKAPRRFGKSVAVGMIVIAYAQVMGGSVQSIFSTGRRASRNLLDICYKLALERGLGSRIVRYNQEELWFMNDDGTTSKIFSYPANAKISEYSLCVLT